MVSQRRPLAIVDDTPPALDLEREAHLRSCGALADFWYVACLSRELTTTAPLARTILGTPIALFRDPQGTPRAVVDRCLHRGAALSAGVVIDGQLCCPYHGWTYGPHGHCVHVPSLGPTQRGSTLDDVEHGVAGLKLAPADVGCLKTFATDSVVVTYEQENDKISGLGFILNPQGKPMVHTDAWYAPNVTRVDYLFGDTSGFVINSQCTPIGPLSSLVYTAISYKLPFGPLSRPVGTLLEPLIHWYTRQVINQDTDIMELQRRGLANEQQASPGPVRFASTEADLLHADIELIRRWLLEGAVGTPPSSTTRAIEFWI